MISILDWLDKTSSKYSDKIAFFDIEKKITWGELSKISQYIGALLCEKASSASPIAFFMEKSTDAVCALLGVIYADCFYSFIDVKNPEARIKQIIDILEPVIIITDQKHYDEAERLFGNNSNFELINLTKLIREAHVEKTDSLVLREVVLRRKKHVNSTPLYVNFTSGSTGVPKGVAVGHNSVMDFIEEYVNAFEISSDDVMANQAPFDFDVSVKDIYSSIKTGASVGIIPRDYFVNPTLLIDFICDSHTTILCWAVSAMCFVSGMSCFSYRIPEDIRLVMFSGEVMPIKQLLIWRKYLPFARYINLYGPTEITCNCTYFEIPCNVNIEYRLPIGTAFPNEKVFLLDERNQLINECDTEIIGEICVAGDCLALGYYGDEIRTAERFVQNPMNDRYLERIFKTGDLGYYGEDGLLYYSGRADDQIKVNGHRIEMADIERNAEMLDGVERACCIYIQERYQLVLYYMGIVDSSSLRTHLRSTVPDFMIPGKIIQINSFPLNKNGKIDKKKLGENAYEK